MGATFGLELVQAGMQAVSAVLWFATIMGVSIAALAWWQQG